MLPHTKTITNILRGQSFNYEGRRYSVLFSCELESVNYIIRFDWFGAVHKKTFAKNREKLSTIVRKVSRMA